MSQQAGSIEQGTLRVLNLTWMSAWQSPEIAAVPQRPPIFLRKLLISAMRK